MRLKILALAIIVALFLSGSALGDESIIGNVKTQKGQVSIVRQGEILESAVRMPLHEGDIMQTGAQGAVGIVLRDDTVLSLGPDSELVLAQFAFAPREGELSLVTRLMKGTATFMSGIIAKLAPDNARLETPSATIGIRGTHFLVSVAP